MIASSRLFFFMFLVSLLSFQGCKSAPEKIKVTKLDQLPKHVYPVSGKVSQLIESEAQINALAMNIKNNIHMDLVKYEINDPTTLQGMYGTLQTIDLLEGDYSSACKRMEQVRALESKESKKLTGGMSTLAFIDATKEADRKTDFDAFKKAYHKHLADRAGKLPWDAVQDVIKQDKGMAEVLSKNLVIGIVQAQMDPVVEKTGELSADMAAQVIRIHYMIKERLPLNEATISVYQALIDANRTVKADIWADRSVVLSKDEKCSSVLMAAWDSGSDVAIFKDRTFINPDETLNDLDDDKNGFVDDVYGIAYDYHANKDKGWLFPLGDQESRIADVMAYMKGFTDVQAAIDSEAAQALKKHLASLSPDKVKGFLEDLSLAGNYSHGTHVSGIMLEGNPFATLLVARHTYDYHIPPVLRDVEWGKRDGEKCRNTVEYLKRNKVRVVNMSWGEAMTDAMNSMEQNGVGKNAEERLEMAREVFSYQKKGLFEAIKDAPDVLFICAAGNSDNDVEFDEYIPSSFDLPNLLVVGAVDQAGDPTGFTSFGDTVSVYANGFEVESYVPGGARMKMSGTSMASPNVANLAGKVLARKPDLSPREVIDLIKKGADSKTMGETTFLLMNPKKTMDLLN